MAIYSIAFNLNPERKANDLINAIKQYEHAEVFNNYWFIYSAQELKPLQIYNRLIDFLGEKDRIAIQLINTSSLDTHIYLKTFSKTFDWVKAHLQ